MCLLKNTERFCLVGFQFHDVELLSNHCLSFRDQKWLMKYAKPNLCSTY